MEEKIRSSFQRQGLMQYIGAQIIRLEEGLVEISCPYAKELSQQNGFFHAGVITSIVDVACGYAALSVMPPEADVLSIEYKVNFLRPSQSHQIIAIGKVIKAGKRIVVCEGDVFDADQRHIAKMIASMIPVYK